jgi:hypothetical protein
MVKVTHGNGDISGYLHLAKGSVPSSLFSQAITKGELLGSLYTGSAIYLPHPGCTDIENYKFATACGCGYGTHLHFEANHLITIQGYSLQSISNAPYGTPYTSDNSSTCCGCLPASCCSGAATQADGSCSEFKWGDSDMSSAAAPRQCAEFGACETVDTSEPTSLTAVEEELNAADEPISWDREPPIASTASIPETMEASPGGADGVDSPAPVSVLAQRAPVEAQRTPPTSASYRILKSVLGSGGGAKSSTHYVLNTTQGQSSDLSRRTSASYVLVPGYWSRLISLTFEHQVYLPLISRNH